MGSLGEVEEVGVPLSSSTSSPCSPITTSLPFLSLNHVSFVCKSLSKSVKFYEEVLGFVLIKRPSFNSEGAWLFNHGIGIHLLEAEGQALVKKGKINTNDNHISFQCTDMELIIRKLEEMNIEYVIEVVEEGGIIVDQLFFHDPDGYMIEICNCQNLPVLPLSSCHLKLPKTNVNHVTTTSSFHGPCSGDVATLMLENLMVDMMDISM